MSLALSCEALREDVFFTLGVRAKPYGYVGVQLILLDFIRISLLTTEALVFCVVEVGGESWMLPFFLFLYFS